MSYSNCIKSVIFNGVRNCNQPAGNEQNLQLTAEQTGKSLKLSVHSCEEQNVANYSTSGEVTSPVGLPDEKLAQPLDCNPSGNSDKSNLDA